MEDPRNLNDGPVIANDSILLTTQQALLAEMKRHNELLEEQLRRQTAADARKKAEIDFILRRQGGAASREKAEKDALRKERERRIRYYQKMMILLPIVKTYRLKCASISNITLHPAPFFPNYMGDAGLSEWERKQISDHNEKQRRVPEQLAEENIAFEKKIKDILSGCSKETIQQYHARILEIHNIDEYMSRIVVDEKENI